MAAAFLPICRAPRHHRGGFTLAELLALVAIVALLAAIFIPYFLALGESNRRTICADNLRQLFGSLTQYAKLNGTYFPRVVYDPEKNRNGYTAFTGPDDADPFALGQAGPPTSRPTTKAAAEQVQPSDVTASLWLLVREDYITDLSVFICPSTTATPDTLTDSWGRPVAATHRSNFRHSSNLSYSYADPFSGYADYKLDFDQPGGFALLADRNPGTSAAVPAHDAPRLQLAVGNSLNHQRAGQNVLYADGSVSFEVTPYCGVGPSEDGDNIFTTLSPTPLASGDSPFWAGNGYCGRQFGPSYQYDSYLVPTYQDGR
jgi:prepilin-type processing-associated H-X9-DG protein